MRSVRHTMGAVQAQVDPLSSALEEQSRFDNKKNTDFLTSQLEIKPLASYTVRSWSRGEKKRHIFLRFTCSVGGKEHWRNDMQTHEKLILSHFVTCYSGCIIPLGAWIIAVPPQLRSPTADSAPHPWADFPMRLGSRVNGAVGIADTFVFVVHQIGWFAVNPGSDGKSMMLTQRCGVQPKTW